MITMTMSRLGNLRYPAIGCVGSGAKAAFSGRTRGSWVQQHGTGRSADAATVQLIPPFAVDNSTSVSAARERSP